MLGVKKNQRGFSLIGVMITAPIISFAALAVASITVESERTIRRSETTSVRRILTDRFHDLTRNPVVMQNTVDANTNLQRHIDGTRSRDLTDLDADPPAPLYPVRLVNQNGETEIRRRGKFYKADGRVCSDCTAETAYWIVKAFFAARSAGQYQLIVSVEQNESLVRDEDSVLRAGEVLLKTTYSNNVGSASPSSGGLDYDSCYTLNPPTFRGNYTFTCNDTRDEMIVFSCVPSGSEDPGTNCTVNTNSVTVDAVDDSWTVRLKCCPRS